MEVSERGNNMKNFAKKYKGELITLGVCYFALLGLVRASNHKTIRIVF